MKKTICFDEPDRQFVAEIGGWIYYIERCPTLGRTVYWYAVEQRSSGGRPHRARCMSRKSAHERIETWARNRAQMEIVAAR